MSTLRGPHGDVIDVPDDQASNYLAGGYTPLDSGEAAAYTAAPEREDRGVLGGVNALATGALSGVTLGGSDYLLKGLLDKGQFERLATERENHPIASAAGQIGGAIAASAAAPGAFLGNSPAGLLARETGALAEGGRALGGVAGAARTLAAGGIEGAVQNAGMYLSDTALGDRDLSAEGMAGALGMGFGFGVGGGVAALGIEQGTIAARRLFSRAAGTDKAAQTAELAWKEQLQNHIDTSEATAALARARLAEAQSAREQAALAKQREASYLADLKAERPQGAPLRVAQTEPPTAATVAPPSAGGIDWGALEQSAAMSPDQLAAQQSSILSEASEREVAAALAERDAAHADLDAVLRNIEAPTIEPGVTPKQIVPIAEWGPPGMRGYDPGNVKAPGPPSVVDAATGDVTAVGKRRIAEGTPTAPAEVTQESGSALAPKAETTGRSIEQQYEDVMAQLKATKDVPTRRALSAKADELLDQMPLEGVGDVSAAAPERPPPEPIAKGKTIAELKHPDETPENFVLRRMRQQGQEWGNEKRFLGSLGIDWSVPENKALVLKMVNNGDARFARADLVGAMDPAMVKASQVEFTGPGGFGSDELHFIHDTGQPVHFPQSRTAPKAEAARPIASQKEFREIQDALRTKLTPDEIKQSLRYSREYYLDVNRHLRGVEKYKNIPESEKAIIPALDSIIEKSPIPEAMITHRGVGSSASTVAQDLKPGDVFVDPAYLSTTYRDDNIHRFGKAHFVITSPAGTKMAAIPSSKTEGEFLMPRGTRLRVTGREELEGGRFRIYATVEQPAATTPAAASTLTGQLRSMQSKLGDGADLKALGEPSRLEYAATKATKTEEASRTARAAANEKGYAGSAMAADERAAQSEATAQAGAGTDEFFRNLTRPKSRDAYVAANIGRAMKEEGSHAAALAKVEREWAAMSPADHPMSVAKLEAAHDAAVERAASATTPAEQVAAEHEVKVIEQQMTAVGKRPGAVEDVAAIAQAVTKAERADAKLVEALGPEAPPLAQEQAKAFRAAEDEVERKHMARTTRAIDAHAESGAPTPVAPPTPEPNPDWLREARVMSGKSWWSPEENTALQKGKIRGAKSDLQRADAVLQRAKVTESEAKIGARKATETATNARKAIGEATTAAPESTSRLGSVAIAIGVAGELGVPGIPKPDEIPVIGPLLGAYLKYRAVKAAAGRFAGRIPATGDARAAALAARTKQKIVVAVDRALGLAAETAPKARGGIVATAAALGHRALDDGEPDAKKGATSQEQAAVRIREIANAVARPELVQKLVRTQLRGVTDPDLIDAAEKHLMARFEYLNGVMPKAPPPNPYTQRQWVPSPAQTQDVAQRLSVVNDPESAFVDPTPRKVETAKAVFPRLLELAQQRLLERITEADRPPVPYQQRLKNQLLFDVQLDHSLEPQAVAILQSAHAANRPTPTPSPATPPSASIAADTNLSNIYQTGMDRRAAR